MRQFKEIHLGPKLNISSENKVMKEATHLLQATIEVVPLFLPSITRKVFLETTWRWQIKSKTENLTCSSAYGSVRKIDPLLGFTSAKAYIICVRSEGMISVGSSRQLHQTSMLVIRKRSGHARKLAP